MKRASDHFDESMDRIRVAAREAGIDLREALRRVMRGRRAAAGGIDRPQQGDDSERSLILRYRLQFYEWLADSAFRSEEKLAKTRDQRKRGAQKSASTRAAKAATRKAAIFKKEAELLASGVSKGLNKRIAAALNEKVEYVQDARAERSTKKKRA